MAPADRKAAANGIFLCSSCADMIDKNGGVDFSVEMLRAWKLEHEKWATTNLNKRGAGRGGDGGDGEIFGNRGIVLGGRAGAGGDSGFGGKGGSGIIHGDDGLIVGGDGGNAGTNDGRGGRGTPSPMERLGGPTSLWAFGRGGAGGNHSEYDRRLKILKSIREEYKATFAEYAPTVDAGIDQVPINWVNKRLEELDEKWSVEMGEEGYRMPPLNA